VKNLKHLADNNLNQSDLEEYAYSLHVPERNLQMQRVNSKRYLDMLFRQMGKKESDRWKGEMDKIKEEAEFNDWDLSERHDAFLGLMQDVFANHDTRQKEIDDRQQELDTTTWTKSQIDKGTPEFHQKRLDNKKEKLERSKEIEADWNEKSPRFA